MTYQGHIRISHRYSDATRDAMAMQAEYEASRALPGVWRKAPTDTPVSLSFVDRNLFAFPRNVTEESEARFAKMMHKELIGKTKPAEVSSYASSDANATHAMKKKIHTYLKEVGGALATDIADALGITGTRARSLLNSLLCAGHVQKSFNPATKQAIVWRPVGCTDEIQYIPTGRPKDGANSLVSLLEKGPRTSQQLAHSMGLNMDAVRSRCKHAVKKGIVRRAEGSTQRRVIWELVR